MNWNAIKVGSVTLKFEFDLQVKILILKQFTNGRQINRHLSFNTF